MFHVKSAETYPKIPHCDQNTISVSFRQSRNTLGKYRKSFDKTSGLMPGKINLRSKVSVNVYSFGDINSEKSFWLPGKITINCVIGIFSRKDRKYHRKDRFCYRKDSHFTELIFTETELIFSVPN